MIHTYILAQFGLTRFRLHEVICAHIASTREQQSKPWCLNYTDKMGRLYLREVREPFLGNEPSKIEWSYESTSPRLLGISSWMRQSHWLTMIVNHLGWKSVENVRVTLINQSPSSVSMIWMVFHSQVMLRLISIQLKHLLRKIISSQQYHAEFFWRTWRRDEPTR